MTIEQALLLSRDNLTQAWRTKDWEKLADFFHPTVVFLALPASPLCVGSEACLASYQDFSSQAVIHEYVEALPYVQIVEPTALTTTPFTIRYEYEQVMNQEQGTEILTWVKHEERWLVIWRMVISSPVALD
jgi:ketosteroid isomerase-like protein